MQYTPENYLKRFKEEEIEKMLLEPGEGREWWYFLNCRLMNLTIDPEDVFCKSVLKSLLNKGFISRSRYEELIK